MAEKVFTNVEHVAWLKEQARLKRPYWYGCYYNPCTEALLQKKKAQYPEHYGESRMARYRADIAAGQIAGDCVNGAIKGAVWSELGKRKPVYASHGCPDTNADGMFAKAKELGMDWGPIGTLPEKPGVAVRFSGHVGVYIGNGEVVEWRGFAHGCVTTKLKARKWTHWYELPWTEYIEDGQTEPQAPAEQPAGMLGAQLLKKGAKGDAVRTLQEMLMGLGYELPEYGADGDFGDETELAVRQFQAEHGLEADGKYGPLTHKELMQELAEQSVQDRDDEDEAAPAAPTKYVEVTGATVWIRKGPGTEYDGEGVVRRGARLEWVATAENGWHAVRADGVSGWIGPRYSAVKEAE